MIFLGVIFVVSGIASIIYGVNQNNSLSSQLSSLFKSGSTNPGTIYIILGVVIIAIGLTIGYIGYTKNSKIITDYNTKKCPFCANELKKEAIVCQFCSRDLPQSGNN